MKIKKKANLRFAPLTTNVSIIQKPAFDLLCKSIDFNTIATRTINGFKELFYSNLTMENITETDYIHANNVFKTFKLNNLGDYHIYTFKVRHCYLQMSSRILEKLVLERMN